MFTVLSLARKFALMIGGVLNQTSEKNMVMSANVIVSVLLKHPDSSQVIFACYFCYMMTCKHSLINEQQLFLQALLIFFCSSGN